MNSPKPSVRSATIQDADDIARWQIAMAYETEGMQLDAATVLAGVKHVFAHPDIGDYMIGCIDDKPVACLLLLREWSDWRCGTVLWIHSLYVEKTYRRTGIFKAMYDRVRSRVADDSSLRGIRLYVDKTNATALKTYSSIGMDGNHYQTFEWMK